MFALLKYVVLPKGVRSILRKLIYYLPGIVSGFTLAPTIDGIAKLVSAFVILEFGFGTLRRQLNDYRDFEADKRRGRRWGAVIHSYPRSLLAAIISAKAAILAAVVVVMLPACAGVAFTLLATQLIHDWLGRGRSATVCTIAIGCAYFSRAIAPWLAISFQEIQPTSLLGLAGALLAVSNTFEWKSAEEKYLLREDLERKEVFNVSPVKVSIIAYLANVVSAVFTACAMLTIKEQVSIFPILFGLLLSIISAIMLLVFNKALLNWITLGRTAAIGILILSASIAVPLQYAVLIISFIMPAVISPIVLESSKEKRELKYFARNTER